MKQAFLNFKCAMTLQELAALLRRKEGWVRAHSSGPNPLIPRLPGYPIRFDPMVMIDVFCRPQRPEKASSLTIERHKAGAKPTGGYRKCL